MYRSFPRLVRYDGMGGVSIPYEGTIAFFEEQGIDRPSDREAIRQLWEDRLIQIQKVAADEREKRGGGADA